MTSWKENSYAFVSLYDMLKFSAHEFYEIAEALQMLSDKLPTNKGINDEYQQAIREGIANMEASCKKIGLQSSLMYFARFRAFIAEKNFSVPQARKMIDILSERIRDDMTLVVFMHIPGEKAKYFNDSISIFGKTALDSLRSCIPEVEEAGKCYAAGRNTATVFHLMRVMEASLKIIAQALNIPTDTNRSWDAILKKINDAVELRHARDEWTDFYSGVIARLYAVKDAWRNPTMHVERSYGEEEAIDIFNCTAGFIRHLSSRLSEPGTSV